MIEVLKQFKEWVSTDKTVSYLWELNKSGKATYETADIYAKGIASKMSSMLTEAYGDADYSDIVDEVASAYKKAYTESAYFSKVVQSGINKDIGIGMKAVEPAIDDERIVNLMEVLEDENTTTQMAQHLLGEQAIESVTRTAVADTIKANARIQSKAGLHAYIERDAGAGCCTWCSDIAGKYEYPDVPDDIWRVHAGCTCKFIYRPSKDEIVRIRYETNNGRLTKITE